MINDDLKNKILEGFKYFTNRYAQDITYRKNDETTRRKLSNFCENLKIFSNNIFNGFETVDHGKWQNSGNISKYIWNRYKPFKNESHLVIYFAVLAKPSNFYISIGLIDTKLSDAEEKLKDEIYNFLESECKKIHIDGFKLDKFEFEFEKNIFFAIENIETFTTLDYTSLLKALTNIYQLAYDKFYKNIENNQHNNSDNEGYKMTDNDKKLTYPLNQILYGPPGTGKTYKLLKIMDKFTQNLNVKSGDDTDALYEMLKIENYTWYQVAAAILCDAAISNINGGWLKLNNGIVNHILFKLKSIKSNSKKPSQTISSYLLFHTKYDCKYVNVKRRDTPFIFEKNEKSEWCVDIKALNDECPEAIELYEKYKEIKEQKVGTSYTKENFKFITFHQSYGYEEFVEGIKPVFDSENEDGDITYEISKGIFYQCCENALLLSNYKGKLSDFCDLPKDERQKFFNENTPKYAIFIDEINRGNISKIFGELITLIEPSKRLGTDDEIMVELPYSKEKFGVPSNLYIIGTMNTADRSIALMDTALRRRFDFVEMMPEYDTLNKTIIEGINVGEMLKTINERIEYLYDRDHTIGHAYFINVSDLKTLANVFKNKILPLLQEYFYDDWEKIRLVLGDSQFIKEKKPANALFKSGTDYINDKILYEIDKEAFYDEQNYLKIYNSTSSQVDEAKPANNN
ncbi:McrB family protein [Campylobacter concisus]|uniref:McrB family protein n=1 Tax=Campylobacter concisus TaxID=199 RepID=UPI001CB7BE67|nr:AAA family ATPase [Campylobacter concisus]